MTNHKHKWEFAIGTTSRVPDSRHHYLIVDIDDPDYLIPALSYLINVHVVRNIIVQETQRGYHIYTDSIMRWVELVRWLPRVPGVDRKWIKIGKRRGYLFLADKDVVTMLWPVERMMIHGKVKRDSGRLGLVV